MYEHFHAEAKFSPLRDILGEYLGNELEYVYIVIDFLFESQNYNVFVFLVRITKHC